ETNLNTYERYTNMLVQTNEWNPPEKLAVLKKFMIEQIEDSIKFDCHDEKFIDTYYPIMPLLEPEVWLQNNIEEFEKQIEYHREEYAKDLITTYKKNEWIRILRESL